MYCVYCQRECKSKNSLIQHQIRCKKNPDRILVKPSYGMLGKKGGNQFTVNPDARMPAETREKLSISTSRIKREFWAKQENRDKQSIRMKQAVSDNPTSYTSSNRGRCKQQLYKNITFHSSWEVVLAQWFDLSSILWERNTTTHFSYIYNGVRSYFPDFYLPELDVYVEVKGYETDRDRAKWSQFPDTLLVVDKCSIAQIKRNTFDLSQLLNLVYKKEKH